MATDAEQLSRALIALMKADSTFNTLDAYYIGSPYDASILAQAEVCVVIPLGDDSTRQMTGTEYRRYFFDVVFLVKEPDTPTFTDGIAVIQSHMSLLTYTQGLRNILQDNANNRLGSPTLDSGYQVVSVRTPSQTEAANENRQNSYETLGTVPLEIEVLK